MLALRFSVLYFVVSRKNFTFARMRRKYILTALCFVLAVLTATAQEARRDWETLLEEVMTAEDMESEAWEENFELLSELAEHPIDLNHATREELERLPFLSAQQVEELQAYIYQYGGMRSLGELAMIESLDRTHQQLLSCFIYLGKEKAKGFPSLRTIAKYGKHDFVGSVKIPFYNRAGDDNGYLGYKYRHSLRYTFSYSDFVKIGFTAAQDAGEPFFANKNSMGYDHYSFYVALRRLGRLKALVIGRYKLRMGLGLVLNNSYGYGKMSVLSSLGRSTNDMRGHSGRSSANYLQGAAATVEVAKGIDLTAFVSWRKIDATLNSGDSTIATILTSGYHRTESELARKNNASQTLAGGNLHWFYKGFHVGATALYTSFDKPLQPKNALYRRYYPTGKKFWNASIDYGYMGPRISFSGETAMGDSHALATLNALTVKASSTLSLTAVQRFYSYKYYSLFSESFADGSRIQNESGIYVGANWQPLRGLSLTTYFDYAYSPWAKYQVDFSSNSFDYLLQGTYSTERWSLSGRYRIRVREKNNEEKTALIKETVQRARLAFTYNGGTWTSKTQADYAHSDYKTKSRGYMLSETFSITPLSWLQVNATFAYFHTDDYSSRLYAYERGPLYTFSFPAYYGEGIRYALFARVAAIKNVTLIAKVGTTNYFDRAQISSGLQQIDASAMTDLELQVKWRF